MSFTPNTCFSRTFNLFLILLGSWACAPVSEPVQDLWLPASLVFAGDTVPLSDPDIRERLEKELWINAHWYSSTAQWLRRAKRWKPRLDSILQKNNLPTDLQYLVAIESGYDNVTSNKGAVGFWQLMEPTAREFGLRIGPELDERLDPEKSTQAACGQIKRGFAEFKKWPETVVAYNVGVAGLKSVLESQYSESFYDIQINPESGRYWFRVLAAKLLLENPEKYGFGNLSPAPENPSRKELLHENLPDIPWWCRKKGFSYKCFRSLNPWIKGRSLNRVDSLGPVTLQIPLACRVYSRNAMPDIPDADSLQVARQVVQNHLVNDKNMVGLKSAQSQATEVKPDVYTVESGDHLGKIAQKTGISQADLLEMNPSLKKRKGRVRQGERLRLTTSPKDSEENPGN